MSASEWLAAARVAPTVAQIKASEPETFVNYHRVRIDPIKAQNMDAMIRFEFTDASNNPVALHVRRGAQQNTLVPRIQPLTMHAP